MALNYEYFSHENSYHMNIFMKESFSFLCEAITMYRHVLQKLFPYNCDVAMSIIY